MKKITIFIGLLLSTVMLYGQSIQNSKANEETKLSSWNYPYTFALRTSFIFDALLIPTIGAEWRINSEFGIKWDGGLSNWGSTTGKRLQRIQFMRPEARWYLGEKKNLYVGVSSNIGKYNIYKGVVGSIISSDTGYDGNFWNVGACAGYLLDISQNFSIDFNMGLGYNKFKHDTFNMVNDTRIYKDLGKTKEFFGPTQICVSLVWKVVK